MIVVLKVTRNCNLRCEYCYMNLSDIPDTMSISVVRAVVEKFGSRCTQLNFSWHGGEPLLAGTDFYRQALQIQEGFYRHTSGKGYQNSIQTNGTLLNKEWLQFLWENNFSVGISYDGPGTASRLRRTQDGRRVFPLIEKLFMDLNHRGERTPGVICVVSKANYHEATAIYNHFKLLNLDSFSLLPYLGGKAELQITAQEYFEFHKTIFDIWINDSLPFARITPLSQIIAALVHKDRGICSWEGRCFQDLVSIDPNGDVYLCSAFHEENHRIGNVLADDLDDIFNHPNYLKALDIQKRVLEACGSCDIRDICKGGCREAAYSTYGMMDVKDPYCEGRRALVHHILDKLGQELQKSCNQ